MEASSGFHSGQSTVPEGRDGLNWDNLEALLKLDLQVDEHTIVADR